MADWNNKPLAFDKTKFIEEETYGEHQMVEKINSEGELV